MSLSNPVKSFLLALVFLTACAGCRFWQNAENTNTSPMHGSFAEDKSDLPFSVREPQVYQCQIVVTSNGDEHSTFIARNGDKRRTGYPSGLVLVKADASWLMMAGKKIYAEETTNGDGSPTSAWMESLTVEWLNVKPGTAFESLGTDGKLKKFTARLNESTASEMIVFIDENGLPVKQEYYSIAGEQRDLLYSVELRDLKLEAEDALFAVPNDFKKVTIDEVRNTLRNR